MDISGLLASLESSGIATKIRESLYIFPLLESIHVFGLALVFGTIAVIDLRLLGLASIQRPFSKVASDIFKWTWAAFAITAATGALMFITNAGVYFHNFFFRTKMLMLLLAGLNMLIFEITAKRSIDRWDKARSASAAGRTVAVVSLVIWITVIFLGRWIGFTTTRTTVSPDEPQINFDNLFPGTPNDKPNDK
jgi:hypothetical protein